jgi:hypothetical protein
MWQHIQTLIDRQLKLIMEKQYQKLNKKLDTLTKNNPKQHNTQKTTKFQPKVINLSDKHFTKEQINILYLGPSHAKEPKKYINELIVDTEVAIRHLDPKLQSTFRYLAAKQIKHLLKSNRHNVFHNRLQYSINKIKKIMEKQLYQAHLKR